MHEGLALFEEVVQNPIFEDTPIFVFLNKKDLFEQMMKEGVPLTRCFPDYRVRMGEGGGGGCGDAKKGGNRGIWARVFPLPYDMTQKVCQ